MVVVVGVNIILDSTLPVKISKQDLLLSALCQASVSWAIVLSLVSICSTACDHLISSKLVLSYYP